MEQLKEKKATVRIGLPPKPSGKETIRIQLSPQQEKSLEIAEQERQTKLPPFTGAGSPPSAVVNPVPPTQRDVSTQQAVPVAPQPVAPQPVAPQPVAPQPVAPQPVAPQPVAPQPVAPQPVAPQPVAPQPVAPQPVAPQPVAPQPVALVAPLVHAPEEALTQPPVPPQGVSTDRPAPMPEPISPSDSIKTSEKRPTTNQEAPTKKREVVELVLASVCLVVNLVLVIILASIKFN